MSFINPSMSEYLVYSGKGVSNTIPPKCKVIDGNVYERCEVYRSMLVPEDVAFWFKNVWESSEQHAWIKQHGFETFICARMDLTMFAYNIVVVSYLPGKRYTEFILKFK